MHGRVGRHAQQIDAEAAVQAAHSAAMLENVKERVPIASPVRGSRSAARPLQLQHPADRVVGVRDEAGRDATHAAEERLARGRRRQGRRRRFFCFGCSVIDSVVIVPAIPPHSMRRVTSCALDVDDVVVDAGFVACVAPALEEDFETMLLLLDDEYDDSIS